MEEILASIRRIIADDEAERPVTFPPAAAARAETAAPQPSAPALKPVAPSSPPAQPIHQTQPAASVAPARESQATVRPVVAVPSPSPVEDVPADILELTEEMRVHEQPAAPAFRTISAQSDVIFAEEAPRPIRPAVVEDLAPSQPPQPVREHRPVAATAAPPPETESPLMSNSTGAAVDAAFASLAHTVLANNARTLDDLVKDMLRPMLKSWLDDNLPSLVERLVRAEIERVSRGR